MSTNNKWWLNRREPERELTNNRWLNTRESRPTQKLPYVINVPALSITNIPWIGASFIITEFWGTASGPFKLRWPNTYPSGNNLVLAIRNVQQNATGLDMDRYKLWSFADNIFFPEYAGEVIAANFVIEVWNTPSSTEVSLDTEYTLVTNLLSDPTTCCDDVNPEITLTEVCSLFDTPDAGSGDHLIPIVWDDCYDGSESQGDTYYRVVETGEIRNSSTGTDLRVYQ